MSGKRRIISRNLPEEIMEEILHNLPIKSLLRFKCVSKSWLFTISSKAFIKEHLKRSIAEDEEKRGLTDLTNHKLIFKYESSDRRTNAPLSYNLGSCCLVNKPEITPTLNIDIPMPTPNACLVNIMGSCNGLILIKFRKLILWNPSTRKHMVIPSPSFDPIPQQDLFHVRLYRIRYGLGYDEANDDYKVVSIRQSDYQQPHLQTKVYSSKTDSWKEIECSNFKHCFQSTHYGEYVNGRLHWLAECNKNRGNPDIISFDFKEENINEYSSGPVSLVELGGYLGLMNITSDADVNVWVMKEYGARESWTRVWTSSDFGVDQLGDRSLCRGRCARPLCWRKNGDMLVAFG
ncbi:hypothetical protein MIMGU_mgv1a022804mg, partial [Erythranthe guttata]